VVESLLLTFAVNNFRSIREEQELNLTRGPRDEVEGFPAPDVAPAAAIFGANAAGKSNLLRALTTMFRMIRTSASDVEGSLPYTPFALDGASERPTLFVVNVRFDGVRHEYGFTFDRHRIVEEWLRVWPKGRQRVLFERDVNAKDEWYFGDSLMGSNQTLARATRPDALFLGTARLLSHEQLGPLHERFASLVRSLSSENFQSMLQTTLESLREHPAREAAVAHLLSQADLGIVGLHIEEEPLPEQASEMTRRIVEMIGSSLSPVERARLEKTPLTAKLDHQSADGSVPFPFVWESTGTKNFLIVLGPVLERLASGGVLVVDEIDASLHPRLVSELVRMFQLPESNDQQAQVILSTHDVTVMMNVGDYDVLQRDQIWFVEKEQDGSSHLKPLMMYKPRKDDVFSRNYLNDRYGGIPRIDSKAFFSREVNEEP
jgi:hypothetical protein